MFLSIGTRLCACYYINQDNHIVSIKWYSNKRISYALQKYMIWMPKGRSGFHIIRRTCVKAAWTIYRRDTNNYLLKTDIFSNFFKVPLWLKIYKYSLKLKNSFCVSIISKIETNE